MTTHKLIDAIVDSVVVTLIILLCIIILIGAADLSVFVFNTTDNPILAGLVYLVNAVMVSCLLPIYFSELSSLPKTFSGFFKKRISDKNIINERIFKLIKNIIKIIILSIATIILLISCGFFIYNFFIKG